MCHFTVDLNTCRHLSKTNRLVESCFRKDGRCEINLKGYDAPDKLTEIMKTRSASKSSTSKAREKFFDPPDRRTRSVVSFEFNDETPCSQCAPTLYARYMEQQERRDFSYQKWLEAEAAMQNGKIMDDMMEELDSMIDEGHRRGSLVLMEEERKNKIGAGLRKKPKDRNLRARFASEAPN